MRLALVAAAAVVSWTPVPASAQQGIGAVYGAHDPRGCPERAGTGDGLTAEQAKTYFICDAEKLWVDNLYLVSDVTVQIGKGRPFSMATDAFSDVDPSQTVYPIRGSYTSWTCTKLGSINGDPGKNCMRVVQPKATGICYKSTFAEWHCTLLDIAATSNFEPGLPPPDGP